MIIRIDPLLKYRDYRLLFFGQLVSFLGSMISYVAVPYQVYELTHSSLTVGLLGTVQLLPMVFFGLLGGSVADSTNRRKLILIAEACLSLGVLALMVNSMLDHPSVPAIFVITALVQIAVGFHRPAMDAMTQQMVEPQDYAAVSALGAFRHGVGAVLGPALGGILIAVSGAKVAYAVDFLTFAFSFVMIALMSKMPSPPRRRVSRMGDIREGLAFALKKPELMGTYIVDIVAMTFAFPTALFPAIGDAFSQAGSGASTGAKITGTLFSALSFGSLLMTLLSGWSSKVKFHGRAVVLSALVWGLGIIALGYAPSVEFAILCLVVAGAADMVSGLFRGIIWNETIPNHMRGRLSGIEMISYMSGHLLGNARAGWMAGVRGNQFSIVSGGVICSLAVVACALLLPRFWNYRSETVNSL
jgi:MFS family permease